MHAVTDEDTPQGASGIRVALVIDDHPLFCEALTLTLRTALGVQDIATAASLATGIERAQVAPAPDIILLDLRLPDTDGLDGLIRLRKVAAGTPVIVISSLSDDRMIASVLKAGAAGFVPKHSQRAVFVEAINRILAGQTYTPDGYVAQADDVVIDDYDVIERLRSLTAQQARILELVCEGKLNKQIAYELDIAETTVKAHLTAILRKLHVQSRTQAVLIAQNARFAAILNSQR
jgi:DNA-binding NarL/FixJ family response regulator